MRTRLGLVGAERAPRQHVARRALEEDALAAHHAPQRDAQGGRVVARVRRHVHAGGDGVAAEADDGRDRAAISPAGLQRDHLPVDQPVGTPAVDDVAVGSALATVDVDVDRARAPRDRGRLQRVPRPAARRRRPRPPAAARTRPRRRRRPSPAGHCGAAGRAWPAGPVRVVPVEQHARRIGAGASATRARSSSTSGAAMPMRVDRPPAPRACPRTRGPGRSPPAAARPRPVAPGCARTRGPAGAARAAARARPRRRRPAGRPRRRSRPPLALVADDELDQAVLGQLGRGQVGHLAPMPQ